MAENAWLVLFIYSIFKCCHRDIVYSAYVSLVVLFSVLYFAYVLIQYICQYQLLMPIPVCCYNNLDHCQQTFLHIYSFAWKIIMFLIHAVWYSSVSSGALWDENTKNCVNYLPAVCVISSSCSRSVCDLLSSETMSVRLWL